MPPQVSRCLVQQKYSSEGTSRLEKAQRTYRTASVVFPPWGPDLRPFFGLHPPGGFGLGRPDASGRQSVHFCGFAAFGPLMSRPPMLLMSRRTPPPHQEFN